MKLQTQARPAGRRRKGVAVLLTAGMMAVTVPIVGLAVDASLLYAIKARLVAAVDAGALAGARSLSRGQDLASQRDNAASTAERFFTANFPDQYLFTTNRTVNTVVDETQLKLRTVKVTASVRAPLYFMRSLGLTSSTIVATGTAARRDVNIMLVIDRSGSLGPSGSNACADVKEAAKTFVSYFANGRDRIGLVSFAITYNVDFAPSFNFQTASPNINTKIDAINCTSGTSTAQALTKAWEQIKTLNEPGALNAIVFFTDGQPNTITADWPIKTSSTCNSKTPKRAGLALAGSTVYGLYQYLPGSTEGNLLTNDSGCSFYPNHPNYVTSDIAAYMVAQDIYGNSTSGYRAFLGSSPYKIVNYSSVYNNNMAIAATNAADNAATAIRNDTLKPVIYSIGLGGASDAPAETFMRRVANDPGSPIYDSSKPAGMYVYAPNKAQLKDAFIRIASMVLRLAQ